MSQTRLQLVLKFNGEMKPISVGQKLLVGRHRNCDLRLDDRELSKMHCVFERNELGLVVQDLESANGTFVNGLKVGTIELKEMDQVVAGRARFLVVLSLEHENAIVDRLSRVVAGMENPFALSVSHLALRTNEIDRLAKDVGGSKIEELKAYRDDVIQLREAKTVFRALAQVAGRICESDEVALFVASKEGRLERKAEACRVPRAGPVEVPQKLVDQAFHSRVEAIRERELVVPFAEGDEVRAVLYCVGGAPMQEDAALLREAWKVAALVLEEC